MAKIRYLEILNKFEWESEGKKKYAYNYAIVYLGSANYDPAVRLSHNEKKKCNEPFTHIVEKETYDLLSPGDLYSFEYYLDDFDRKVPYLANKVCNIIDIINS